MAESRGRKTLYPAPVTNHATSRGVGGGGPPGPRVRFRGGLPRNRHGAYGAFAVKMQSRRDADSPDGAPAKDRRPVLPVGASQRHRPAQRGETAQRQPRTSAGTAWNADLWAVLPVGPGTRWPPASARRIGKWRCGSPPGTYPTGRTSQMSAFPCLQVAAPGGLGTQTCTIPELHFRDRPGVRADPIMDVSLPSGQRCRSQAPTGRTGRRSLAEACGNRTHHPGD